MPTSVRERPLIEAEHNVVVLHRGAFQGIRPRKDTRHRYRRLGHLMALSDGLSFLAGFAIWYAIVPAPSQMSQDLLLAAVTAVASVAIFGALGLYSVFRITPAEEFRRLLVGTGGSLALLFVTASQSPVITGRSSPALAAGLVVLFVLGTRRLWHRWIGFLRIHGDLQFRALVLGTNQEARQLAEMMNIRSTGYELIGFVETSGSEAGRPLPKGEVERIRAAIRDRGAEAVVIASTATNGEAMRQLVRVARLEGVELRVSANMPEFLPTQASLQPLGRLMTLSIRPQELSGHQAAAKRFMDLLLTSVFLVALLPVFVAAAAAIKIDSPGPVFFRQRRIGMRGKPFTMLKFRTMVADAEARLADVLVLNESDGALFKIKRDPRVTRVGRVLRRWSLDELPQLINILAGNMSLVGPRPALPSEVERYEDWHFDRLEVRPGISGLWQVSGRSALGFDDYVHLDLFYIENWSLAYDLFILAKTIPAVFGGRGSY